jgi:hypothetical protein
MKAPSPEADGRRSLCAGFSMGCAESGAHERVGSVSSCRSYLSRKIALWRVIGGATAVTILFREVCYPVPSVPG